MPEEVKQVYLKSNVTETVVTKAVDGYPQRVIATALIRRLESAGPWSRLPGALSAAIRLAAATGTGLTALVREGLAMRKNHGLPWSHVAMGANAPMLTRATMVEGRLDVGILPSGQVTGLIDELPTVEELMERIMDQATDALVRLGVESPD